ncbi:MAG: hypothetical protein JWN13_7094 [Betaproteobacteria bacterium]|nr:hypothetical protein [Betaproteobacteria bacterium]
MSRAAAADANRTVTARFFQLPVEQSAGQLFSADAGLRAFSRGRAEAPWGN